MCLTPRLCSVSCFWSRAPRASCVANTEWVAEYRATRPDAKALQAEVDEYMEAFGAKEVGEREKRETASEMDADGFTLVTRKRKQKDVTAEEATAARRKKKGGLELENFYRFQMRENKRDREFGLGFACEGAAVVRRASVERILRLTSFVAGTLPSPHLGLPPHVSELAQLRIKFEEDKERVRRLKSARSFNPYA